ncbi:protein YIP4 [Parachaetomium inaequale]|uniref:Protein YIP4 n=1 Tax=Parachaetomium inaequale TaxID=2588326 RepID=A0AAN6PER9_9PEZI|nr:protein YIP4 [Parachaetomium inaequale]
MDPRDQTFMTIHNLTPDANILFASDSILDILGYQPDEVRGKSAFEYFHPEEVPFARSVHSRGVLLDKAAVLHYARIVAKNGQWMSCECCFTVVHNVLVASTSIYFKGERSERRARDAPQIRRIFSSSPRDPRYHMLEHLSPKFKMPPMEREPRAALILNRFTRNLTIMYATDAVAQILGVRPDELLEKPFYECIQPNCLDEAERCLESAKANESIAYLRFWYKDPRIDPNDPANGEEVEMEDEANERSSPNGDVDVKDLGLGDGGMDIDGQSDPRTRDEDDGGGDEDGGPRRERPRRQSPQTFELEAVVSCTSDGLVVVLRRARPPIPDPQPPVMPAAFNFENGLFAAPWGLQPIEPYISPELLYTFRPPLLPQYMPLRECVKAAGGPPLDQLMRSIRDVAVFAWAVTGINPTLAGNYGQGGRPRIGGGAQPPVDGLPAWEPDSRPTTYPPPEDLSADRNDAPPKEPPFGGRGGLERQRTTTTTAITAPLHEAVNSQTRPAPHNPQTDRFPGLSHYTTMAASSRRDYQNVPAVDLDDDDLIDPDDADLNTFDDPLSTHQPTTASGGSTTSRTPLTGTIGSSSSNAANSWTSRIPGEDRTSATLSTIDESVWATLRRDLLAVWHKLREVLYPRHLFSAWGGTDSLRGAYASLRSGGFAGAREELAGLAGRVMDADSLLGSNNNGGLRDWDLWGPLVFCLLLSTLLCLKSREQQREVVFSGVFAMVWVGMAVVTVQIKLLGGNISFAQSICVIGYTLFPLVVAALLSALRLHWIARIPVYLVLVAWSLAAGVSILGGSGVVKNRVGLAVYPLFVFYLGLGCLCFIS